MTLAQAVLEIFFTRLLHEITISEKGANSVNKKLAASNAYSIPNNVHLL